MMFLVYIINKLREGGRRVRGEGKMEEGMDKRNRDKRFLKAKIYWEWIPLS